MRSTFYVAMLFTLLMGCSITRLAASGVSDDFKVTEVFLKADDGRPTGPCPLRVTFRGYITANGPGAIKYTFTRSDGATGPVYIMEFKKAGTQAVMTDWTLGDPRVLPRYSGWQAVKVLLPEGVESNHDTGSFEINCTGTSGVQTNPNQRGESEQPSSEMQAIPHPIYGRSTAPIKLKQNQTARLEVANTGDQSLIVWLFFRDSEGKVLIQKEVKIYPGADEALEYSIRFPDALGRNPQGPHSGDFLRAAVGTKETKLLSSLRPTLRISDTKSGETIRLVGDFMKEQLGPPVSQPNAELNPKGLGGDRDQGFPIGFTTAAFPVNEIGLMRLTLTSVTPESKLGRDPVVLQFVDNDGKVLAYQVATVSKGHDAVLLFSPDTGQAAIKAQFGSNDKRSLLLIRPTLEIIDRQSKSVKTIEPNGFHEFTPNVIRN